MSSEIIGKLLAGGLSIKVATFSTFELTLSPTSLCNESNSLNVSFDLCELETALLDGDTGEVSIKTVETEFSENDYFCSNCR